MAGRFDATKSAGFDGTIVFDLGLSDGTRNSWAAPVRDGRARARAAGAPDAALTVRAPLADFIRVSMGGGSLYPMIADGRSQQHEDAQVRREPAWPARLVHDELHIIAQSGYSGEVPTSIGTNRGDQA